MEPAAQVVAPVQPLPPHCPYTVCVAPAELEVEVDVDVVVVCVGDVEDELLEPPPLVNPTGVTSVAVSP